MTKLLYCSLCFYLILGTSSFVFAQHSISIRATPLHMGKPKIDDTSPGEVVGSSGAAFNGGVEYNYQFNSGLGIGAGVDIGYTTFGYHFQNPSSIKVMDGKLLSGYLYNTLCLNVSNTFKFRKLNLRAFAGPGLRIYYEGNSPIILSVSDNRLTWSKGTKAPEPLIPNGNDQLLAYLHPPTKHTQFELNTGFSIEKSVSKSSILVLGLRKNWGLQPINEGDLTIRANNQLYTGSFNTFSNYLGIDFAFKYNFLSPPRPDRENKDTPKFSNSRKAVYGEFLGNGPTLSLNYDQRFNRSRNGGPGFRAGIGTLNSRSSISFPLALNYLVGNGRNAFESGIGITPLVALGRNERTFDAFAFLNLGYRFQPLREGLMFRLTWTPAIDHEGFRPDWAGASIGYTFK